MKETNLSLKELRNETIGFEVKIPEDAKETKNNTLEASYTYQLDKKNNIDISIGAAFGVGSIDEALKTASVLGGEIKRRQTIGKNFLIINEMENAQSNIFYFVESSKGYIRAKVALPSNLENKGIQIATSLKSTR